MFHGIIFLKFGLAKQKNQTPKNISVSVLICAKNESENLKNFVPLILAQKYPKFELILINDDSSDDSLDVMQDFERDNDNVRVVNVKPVDTFWKNKKYPLTLGIKASSYDFLLFTDADCRPTSDQWITEMSRHFTNDNCIVLGYGGHEKIRNSFLNLLIRFETVFTAMQYFSFANIGMPYMGVGRNLAYRKETFFGVNGFTNHMHIRSGDDDLFINQVANKQNTALCTNPKSFTRSIPKTKFKDWFNQKRRHVTTASHYKPIFKLLLGLFYISQLLFWSLSIVLIMALFKWQLVLTLFLVRFVLLYLSFGLSAKKFKELDTLVLLPFLELFLVITQMVIFISNLTSKTHHWR